MSQTFEGALVAIVTPFADGSVDETAFRALIDDLIDRGAQGIVPCGTTGESATLSHAEHERVIELAIETVAKRVPVVAGTGSNNTAEAVRLTVHARKAGADGALLITPYYNKPTQDGIVQHFEAVAGEAELPIIVYNIPGRTSRNIEPATMERLSRIEGIAGTKEASCDLAQVGEIIERCGPDFSVLAGEDSLTLPIVALGGRGVITACGNVIPGEMAEIVRATRAGDLEAARAAHYAALPVMRALFLETNPTPTKAALAMMGKIPSEEQRLPMVPMTEANRPALAEALRNAGLLPS